MNISTIFCIILFTVLSSCFEGGLAIVERRVSDFIFDPNLKNVAFYHIYCAASFRDIVKEQLSVVNSTGLFKSLDRIFYSTVGPEKDNFHIDGAKYTKLRIDDGTGWEEDTLTALYDFCHYHPSSNVLYFHDKGSYHNDPKNYAFRQALNCFVLNPNCIEVLGKYDTCGWRVSPIPFIHYSGNFWWAKCSHINRLIHPASNRLNSTFIEVSKNLSRCSYHDGRYFAELWVTSSPTINPADCMDSTIDTSYLFGYKMPPAVASYCPSPSTGRMGSKCGMASAWVNATEFQFAYANMYSQIKECAERRDVLVERSILWYGQKPQTYLDWLDRIVVRRPLREKSLVRPTNSRTIYVYSHEELRAIPNMDTLVGMGYSLDQVNVVFPHELAVYKVGPDLPSL